MLANDDTRCNGASCDLAPGCERFTSQSTNAWHWIHHARHGCIGFIDNGQDTQVDGQSVVSGDEGV